MPERAAVRASQVPKRKCRVGVMFGFGEDGRRWLTGVLGCAMVWA
jgi:hypothetical protein